MRLRTVLIFVSSSSVAVAAPLACSSSSSGTATRDAGAVLEVTDADVAACQASAVATCTLQRKCNPTAQATQYGDGGVCVERNVTACTAGFLAPGTAASAAHTTECAAATTGESCAQDLDLDVPTACAVPAGSVDTGGACSHAAQCMTAFCAVPPASNCGTCQPAPKAGASCLELSTCGQGLACVKGTCVTYAASGDTCSATAPCGTSLDCVMASTATTGKCEAEGASVGAKCDPTLETSAGCNPQFGYYCVADKKQAGYGTCQKAAVAVAGEPCGRVDGVQTDCSGSTCYKQPGDAGAMCVAHASDNGTCNTLTGPNCVPPARCIGDLLDGGTSGKCSLPGTFSCP